MNKKIGRKEKKNLVSIYSSMIKILKVKFLVLALAPKNRVKARRSKIQLGIQICKTRKKLLKLHSLNK